MLKRFFALVVTIASFQVAMAQSSVTGKVTDQSTGAALANVSVTVKGSNRGTTTNSTGVYKLSLQAGDASLVFSSTGFAETEVAIGGKSTIDVIIHILGSGTKSSRYALVQIHPFNLFSRMLLSPVKRDFVALRFPEIVKIVMEDQNLH